MGLGKLFKAGLDNIDAARPPRAFKADDARKLAEQAAQSFLRQSAELLSCFEPLQGEFGLWAVLQTYVQTNGIGDSAVEAVEDGDAEAYTDAILRCQEAAFVVLYEKGALDRLQVVTDLPEAALVQFARMRAHAGISDAPVAAQVATRQIIALTPTEQCAQDFQDMGSSAFKTKYLTNQNGRKIYEQAMSEGKIS
jgi:hypothetical protein